MTLRDRDRKILWGRSGNRCAICKRPLVEAGDSGDVAVVGEEAHIEARSARGPRGGGGASAGADVYDNLILLCAVHHVLVDQRVEEFPPEELRRLKSEHELWVAQALMTQRAAPAAVDLPPLPARLINRVMELDALDGARNGSRLAPVPTVVVVAGMHGVGKSVLAGHWVALNGTHFAGGVLFGDFSRRRHPGGVDPAEVLADFLAALGVDARAVPTTFAQRRQLYVQLTAERQLLVFLDDVEQAAQVVSVLPGGGGSLVVVTSAVRLEELVFDGAQLIELDLFTDAAARALLAEIVGAERLARDSGGTEDLLHLCAGLPIAIRMSGARLVGPERRRSIGEVAASIAESSDRLRALSGDGPGRLDAAFDAAYERLSERTRLVYRRAGLLPAGDWESSTVAVLANVAADVVESAFSELAGLHIVDRVAADRYRAHDLVRHHALKRVFQDDPRDQQMAALDRLLDWLLTRLQWADRAVFPERLRLDQGVPQGRGLFSGPRDAFEWCDHHRDLIEAAVLVAERSGRDDLVWRLAEPLWPYCYNRKAYSLWFSVYEMASQAGERLGDSDVVARMRSCLAQAFSDHGGFERAAVEMAKATRAVHGSTNLVLRASVAEFDAIMRFERGDVDGARSRFQASRRLHRLAGAARGVALQDYHLGRCLLASGDATSAARCLRRAHGHLSTIGDDVIAGRVLRRLAEALLLLNRRDEGRRALESSIDIADRFELRVDQAENLELLGRFVDADGDQDRAWLYRERAFYVYQGMRHPRADLLGAELGLGSVASLIC